MLRTPNIEHERITTAKTRSSFSVDALQFYFSSSCKRRGNTSLVATLSFRESKECARAGPEELSASPSLPKTWERQHHVRERSRTFENEQACPGLKRLFYILSFLTPTFPPFVWKKISLTSLFVFHSLFLFFFSTEPVSSLLMMRQIRCHGYTVWLYFRPGFASTLREKKKN